MSTSISSFRWLSTTALERLDVSGIQSAHSATNLLHPKPFTFNCTLGIGAEKRLLVGFLLPALWAGLLHLGSSINITVRMVLHQVTGKLEHGFKALVTVTASKFLGLGVGHIGAYREARLFLVGVKADARFAPARGL